MLSPEHGTQEWRLERFKRPYERYSWRRKRMDWQCEEWRLVKNWVERYQEEDRSGGAMKEVKLVYVLFNSRNLS